jgi:hypothetical protein
VAADAEHSLSGPCLGRRLDVCLSFPGEEEFAGGAAVGEHPRVELKVVQHVAVVVDLAAHEPPRPGDQPGSLE